MATFANKATNEKNSYRVFISLASGYQEWVNDLRKSCPKFEREGHGMSVLRLPDKDGERLNTDGKIHVKSALSATI